MRLSCSYCLAKLEFENLLENIMVAKCGYLFHQNCLMIKFNESNNCDICNDQTCSLLTCKRIQPVLLPENESVVPTAAQKDKLKKMYNSGKELRRKMTNRIQGSEDECCICKNNRAFDYMDERGFLITNWIQCDYRQCKRWFHWRCVDIKELPPKEFWFCKQKCLDEVKIVLISKYYKNKDILFNSINY